MISLLTESKNYPSIANQELIILTIGIIASNYGERLLDPLDKPPNIIKSVSRLNDIVFRFLKV